MHNNNEEPIDSENGNGVEVDAAGGVIPADPSESKKKKEDYKKIISRVFFDHYDQKSPRRFPFKRDALRDIAAKLGVKLGKNERTVAKNIGDVIYTYRFRSPFPHDIQEMAGKGEMWIILGTGIGSYEFRLITDPQLREDLATQITKVHDATPQIVKRFAKSDKKKKNAATGDEQATLATIRYNRLIDMFGRCVAYSLQNHLRTTVEGIGQIEIDELYVGSNRQGEHFIIPVQVKCLSDKLGVSQLIQDSEFCKLKYPALTPKAIGAQQIKRPAGGKEYDVLVMYELAYRDTGDDILITKRAERHFLLLPSEQITDADFVAGRKWKDKNGC